MSIMLATGKDATLGVLLKNAEAIEFMRKVDTLVVDKTGTLTEGKPRLVSIPSADDSTEERLLFLAGSVERASEHPLAAAIVAAAEGRDIALSPVESFESVTGKGVRARIGGSEVMLGNHRLREDSGISTTRLQKDAEAMRADGQTVMFMAVDGRVASLLGGGRCGQANDSGSDWPTAPRGNPGRDAHWRQPNDGRGGGP